MRKNTLIGLCLLSSAAWAETPSEEAAPAPVVAEQAPVKAVEDKPAGQSLALKDAQQAALKHHPTFENLKESLHQAELLRWYAWSILLPSVTVDGTLTRNNQEVAFSMPGPEGSEGSEMIMQELWGKHLGLTTHMTLFNARSIPLIENAYDRIEQVRLETTHQRNELLYGVMANFYALRAAEEAKALAAEDVGTAEAFLTMATRRAALGMGLEIEVLKAKLAVTEAKKAVDDAGDAVANAQAGLATLTGITAPVVTAEPPAIKPVSTDLNALEETAKRERLDLKALAVLEEMAHRDEDQTKARWIPTFDVTHVYSWDSAAGFSGENTAWRLIFGASWSVFDGGVTLTELYDKQSSTRQLQLKRQSELLAVREACEKARLSVLQGERNVAVARDRLALAEANHRMVTKQYERGLTTSLEVLDATNGLARARRATVLEALQRDLAILELNRVVGLSAEQ